jgi:hypothetical protein
MKPAARPSLEARLRQPLRAAQRSHPEWRRQARAARSGRWRQAVNSGGGLLVLGAVGFSMSLGLSTRNAAGEFTDGLVRLVLAAAALLGALLAGNQLRSRLFHDPALLALALLPVTDEFRVRWQLRRWFRQLGLLAAGAFVPLLGLTGRFDWSAGLLLGAAAGSVGLGLMFGTLGLLAFRHAWVARTLQILVLTTAGCFLGCAFFEPLRAPVIALVSPIANTLALILPTGWIIYPMHRSLADPTALAWLPLVPAGSLLLLAIQEARALLPRVPMRDQSLLGYAAQPPDDCPEEVLEAFHHQLERPAPPPTAAVAAFITTRAFLQPTREPPRDPLFRLVWRWWTPRQRLLAEWGLQSWPNWARRGWRMAAVAAGALLVAVLTSLLGRLELAGAATGVAGLAMASLLPWTFLFPRASRRCWLGNVSVPQLYLHGTTLGELRRADAKRVLVQLLLAAPVVAGVAVFAARIWAQPVAFGLLLAGKLLLLAPTVRAGLTLAWCARQMPFGLKSFLFLPVPLFGGLLALVLALVGFGGPEWSAFIPAALCWLWMEGLAWLTIRLWSRRWFENTLG